MITLQQQNDKQIQPRSPIPEERTVLLKERVTEE